MIASIVRAVALTRAGATAAVVTNPIHKATLYAAGFGFPGHTEFLAELAGGGRPVMMLAGPTLRVVPLTVHIPLAEVPRRLDRDDASSRRRGSWPRRCGATSASTGRAWRWRRSIRMPGRAARWAARRSASSCRHCAQLRAEGIDVVGPLPADTMFHARARAGYDAALCMYHDQALVPVKTLHFDEAVNVTLGLPFVRTSPDHGTALGIAGQGIARPDSLIAAIELAAAMARRRREYGA